MNLRHILAPLALILILAVHSAAQCLVPDNLDHPGGACTGAFMQQLQPQFAQKAKGICWKDCGVDASANYIALWGQLQPVLTINPLPPAPSCGWYRCRLKLYNNNGLAWLGTMHFVYSRTWTETPMPGQFIQVWRYLVNGDLTPMNTTAMPCGIPACAASSGNLVRFTGYVDYAYDCSTNVTQEAWMITHACDSIDHASGSPRAGVFHPNRYFTFVGPSAGFVIGAGGTLEAGNMGLDCVRKWDATVMPARCSIEEPLFIATNTPNSMVCMCGVGPTNWYQGQLFVAGSAGTILQGFLGSDPFRSFPVGMWTNPNVFPGVEEVRWNCNEGQYTDCVSLTRNEYYFGVTTTGGFPAYTLNAMTPPVPLPPTFIDQANSVQLPANVAVRNTVYKSDHVLNLNL